MKRRTRLFLHGLGHEGGVHIVPLCRLTDSSFKYEDLVCHVQGIAMIKVDFELCGTVFVDEGVNVQRLCVRKVVHVLNKVLKLCNGVDAKGHARDLSAP